MASRVPWLPPEQDQAPFLEDGGGMAREISSEAIQSEDSSGRHCGLAFAGFGLFLGLTSLLAGVGLIGGNRELTTMLRPVVGELNRLSPPGQKDRRPSERMLPVVVSEPEPATENMSTAAQAESGSVASASALGHGSCKLWGCGIEVAPLHICQCDPECIANMNCCDDYIDVCCPNYLCPREVGDKGKPSIVATSQPPSTTSTTSTTLTRTTTRVTLTSVTTLSRTTTTPPPRMMSQTLPEFAWSCASYGCMGLHSDVARCQCNQMCREQGTCCHDFEEKCGMAEERVLALGETTPPPVQTSLPPELDDSLCGNCVGDTHPTHEDAVTVYAATCALPANRCCAPCGMWSNMDHGRQGFQIMHGYLVVPSDPLVGMEAITQGTASHYNFLWSEAASQATKNKRSDHEHWALLVNPSMSRTQHQLHIFFKPMSDNGCVLRQQLETLTRCDVDAGWMNVAELGMCIFMRARVYNELPGVFSEVWADAAIDSAHLGPLFQNPQGDQHMGSIGITVMFGCQNRVILLSTSGGGAYCSLEHSIT